MPGQALRQKKIRLKLNLIEREFKGRSVLLVDDSIVRGTNHISFCNLIPPCLYMFFIEPDSSYFHVNHIWQYITGSTSLELVQMARDAGARRVYFASAAPPVKYPNVYGIDIPSCAELVAFERSVEDVAVAIGADKVIYNDLEDVIDAVKSLNQSLTGFDTSCFNGEYVTPEVTEEYLRKLLSSRGLGRTGAKKSAVAVAIASDGNDENNRNVYEHSKKRARVNNGDENLGVINPSLTPAASLQRSISDDKSSCIAK